MSIIKDEYGRTFKTLRVSLLNRCNLACVYCREDEKNAIDQDRGSLTNSVELVDTIKRIHALVALETIRLTGGEPLLYADLLPLVRDLKSLGIAEIKLTTNGYLLERMAVPLKKAGVTSINVSLDALDEGIFFMMSKRNSVDRIISGIEAAIDAGLGVKINSVMMKGVNHSQLIPLLEFAFDKDIIIRFLELMSMGHLYKQGKNYLYSQQEMMEQIAGRYSFTKLPRKISSTSNYWRTDEGKVFGIIANESHPFCHDCNRLRLDSKGNIYGCLSSNHPISIAGIRDPIELQESLKKALHQKQAVRFTGSELSMLSIGG